MIFTTKNKELAIFGKTIAEAKGILIDFFDAFERGGINGEYGIIDTFFSKGEESPLTPKLLDRFEEFKKRFNDSQLSAEALAEQMENIDQKIIDYAKSCKNGALTTEGFIKSINNMSVAAKAGKAVLQTIAATGDMLAVLAFSKGIELAATAFDNYIHRVEKANDAMNDAVSEYESAKSSLEGLTSNLETQNQQLDELLKKDKLTYAEEGQLEELQAITKELMLQQDIEAKRTNSASKEAADKTVDAYKKQYGKYDKTEDALKTSLSHLYPGTSPAKDDVLGNIAEYILSKELLKRSQTEYQSALDSGKDITWYADNVQYHIDWLDERSQILDDNISDLEEKRAALEDEYNKAIDKRNSGINPLTTSENEIIDTYESIYDVMRMVYEYTAPNTWKSMQIENIFNTKGIEKTKEELIKMAKEGTLDESTIQSYPKLSETLEQNKVSVSELCNELHSLAESSSFFNEISSFSEQLTASADSLDKFQSSVKSASEAYASLLSGHYSSTELLDSVQTINRTVTDLGDALNWEEIDSLDLLGEKLEEVSEKYAESVLSNAGIAAGSDFGRMLTDIIRQMYEAEAKFTGMNAQLDRLQSSYKTLTDVLEYYNETGYITLDSLQSLLTADENLISLLEAENGRIVINRAAYENLVAAQLLDFKAKLDDAAAAEIAALAHNKLEEATDSNAQASEDAVAKLDAETEAFRRNTQAAGENAVAKAVADAEDAGVAEEDIQQVLDKYESIWNAAKSNYKADFASFMNGGAGSGGSSDSKSGSSSARDDFEETFDWIETAIERLQRSVSSLDGKANSVYRSWSERNSNLLAELSEVREEIQVQRDGYSQYMQKASSLGLSAEWADRVHNGQADITDITDKALAEQIKQYQDYYEKALKCQDAVEDLRETVSKLYETAFDNIVSQFDSIVSIVENSKSMLDESISQAEEQGYLANAAYYEALITVERENIEQLTQERLSLQTALADAVNSGAVAEGSQAWADMASQINDVTLSIEEANTAMIQYGNSVRDIQWQIFDLIQDKISHLSSESDFLMNLLSSDKQYDDSGQLTDTGMSTVSLHGMNYNVYMAQADKYAQEMLRIEEALVKDPYNQDLAERRQELLELQQEMILAAEDEKQAIRDMVEEGISLELDALKELIDTYTAALDAQKDLYDYQKNIAQQTGEIASLEKQLSAYEGDLSEESRAKIQQLKVSLENARAQLEETEYDRYISDQKKLLDDLYLEYETTLNQRLDNVDALIADMIAASNANAAAVGEVLSAKAESVGYYLSESMEDIWSANTGSLLGALTVYDNNVTGGFVAVNTGVGEVIRGVTDTVSGIGNVNTTISNAISSITGNMQAILSKLSLNTAASGYGGSGSAPSGGGGSVADTPGSSGSGFFIGKRDTYPKASLNINTSVIDRLKYRDFDSSFSARQMYYSRMGLSGTYTGTDAQNARMLEWMKLNGYKHGVFDLKRDEWAWTQEGGMPEVILNSDGSITRPDGSVLTPLKQGDSVLNADATRNLFNFTSDPRSFIYGQLQNLPAVKNTGYGTVNNDIQLSIELPNVQNYEQFKYALQHDKQFEQVVQSMTTGRAAGGSSLKKYKV